MASELWLLCATLAVSLLYYFYYLTITNPRSCSGNGARLPPGPRPLPLIGNILDLRGGGNLHHKLASLARVHGPVMRLKLGLTTTVVISTRDAAREAFTVHDRRLAARAVPDAAHALGFHERSMVWLPSSDARWKTLRGIVASHVFSPRCLAAARAVRERKARDLVSFLRVGAAGAGEDEEVVDFGRVVYGGVLNLVSNALCSVDVVDLGNAEPSSSAAATVQGLREVVEDLVELIAKPNVSDLFPFLRPLDLQGYRRHAVTQVAKVLRVLDGIIDRRLDDYEDVVTTSWSDKKHGGDFLDALMELMSAGRITREDVTSVVFDMFVAGSDTIAITVEWAMAELLRNPDTMDKLLAEISGALGPGSKETTGIEEADVVNLPYLQAVMKEAMRLHPVAPIMLPHKCIVDGVEVGGFAVPEGSTVIFNSWAIMRDPAVWERPDEFIPERFLLDGEGAMKVEFRGKDFEFLPFGSGRRVCPGVPMAERVVPLVLASLLHAFEWRLPDGVSAAQLDVSEKFTTANVMAVPLKAVPFVVNS